MNSRAFNCIFTWWPRTINVRVHGPVCIPDRVNVTELCNYGSAILILFSNWSALHKTVMRKKMIIICFIYFFSRTDTCASCSEPMALHNFPFITFITLAKIIISFSELRTLGMGWREDLKPLGVSQTILNWTAFTRRPCGRLFVCRFDPLSLPALNRMRYTDSLHCMEATRCFREPMFPRTDVPQTIVVAPNPNQNQNPSYK